MKEKIIAFFENEKVKKINRRVFNKKTFITAAVGLVVVAALRITFLLMFEVNGNVTKVDGSKITVSNFLTTQTVDVGNYPIESIGIQPGDRIEIAKNISGQVYSVRDGNKGHMQGNGNERFRGNGNEGFGGKGKHNFR